MYKRQVQESHRLQSLNLVQNMHIMVVSVDMTEVDLDLVIQREDLVALVEVAVVLVVVVVLV